MEIVLALATNLREFAMVLAIVSASVAGIASISAAVDESDRQWAFARKWALGAVASGLLACIPTVDDVWKVRIGLIKYQLASPENVQKATDEIARIGKKLECKYLGGCEEPEKAP